MAPYPPLNTSVPQIFTEFEHVITFDPTDVSFRYRWTLYGLRESSLHDDPPLRTELHTGHAALKWGARFALWKTQRKLCNKDVRRQTVHKQRVTC